MDYGPKVNIKGNYAYDWMREPQANRESEGHITAIVELNTWRSLMSGVVIQQA